MKIKTESEYQKAAEEVFHLMNKGEGNLTAAENRKVRSMALAIQAYEQKLYPPAEPKTLYGMVERKMYEKRLTQLKLKKSS